MSSPPGFEWRLERVSAASLAPIRGFWDDLPLDPYLAEGYRRRRLTRFRVGAKLEPLPAEAVSQSKAANPRFGGIPRHFEPLDPGLVAHPGFEACARRFLDALPLETEGAVLWAHQIRVSCSVDGGRPTPEGIHRDERAFLGLLVVSVAGLRCGATRLYRARDAPPCYQSVLDVGELLVFRDEALFHSTAPFHHVTGKPGHRDTLLFALTRGPAEGTPRGTQI